MPEIKIKHVVSFSSEDKVFKAENLLKPELYRKWKCASSGEKNASVILQFEKASQIHSIDIGNENSAFVEVLVGRSSDSTNNYEVILLTSSFMSPMESRNGNQVNRVRMFSSEKLVQAVRDQKWDLVQIVCTQPFNKNVQYGLSFIKFHSPPDPNEQAQNEKTELAFGAFKLKSDNKDEDTISVGKWFAKRNEKPTLSTTGPVAIRQASLAAIASDSSTPGTSKQSSRLVDDDEEKTASRTKEKVKTDPNKVGCKKVDVKAFTSHSSSTKVLDKKKSDFAEAKKELPTNKKTQSKVKKPKQFNKIMKDVTFALSGFQNPLRSAIRDQALEMGAHYKGDWDNSCTHLICAFVNTPKYNTVRGKGGRIVKKEWILDCHKSKELLPWRKYMLGVYSKSTTEDEESEQEVVVNVPSVKQNHSDCKRSSFKVNGSMNSPSSRKLNFDRPSTSKDSGTLEESLITKALWEGEEEDEIDDAESDYKADTDVDCSSGNDTEDEIRRVIEENERLNTKRGLAPKPGVSRAFNDESPSKSPRQKKVKIDENKPDTCDLPLPFLPDYFKGKKFFMYGDFEDDEKNSLRRYITAYNGHLSNYMAEDVKYVVTKSKWNKDFDEALQENEDLVFIRPQWVFQCYEKEKCVPYQPFIIVPDS